MYTVTIRDHIMISHSFANEAFGPAQHMHGATYVIDVSFMSPEINHLNVVIDIGLATSLLHEVLAPYRYRNLDEIGEFRGQLTTTEFMAKTIHDLVKEKTAGVFNGKIRVTLSESHVAWASYEE